MEVSLSSEVKRMADAIADRDEEIRRLAEQLVWKSKQMAEEFERTKAKCAQFAAAHEQDVPGFVEQAATQGWEAGIYQLPYANQLLFFNPSVVKHQDTLWLIARRADVLPDKRPPFHTFSKLVRVQLTDDGRQVHGAIREIMLPRGAADEDQWEDPRAMSLAGNKIWIGTCVFRQGGSYAHQSLAVLDKDWKILGVNNLSYGNNGKRLEQNIGHEKNWTWFWYDGAPHCVYRPRPHVVIRTDATASNPEEIYTSDGWSALWQPGWEPRGGTNPVLVGKNYWSFFHTSQPWWIQKRRYVMAAYRFEAKPPFRVTGVTPLPMLIGSRRDPRGEQDPLVVFPCGAEMLDDGRWLVVMGINDCRCGWVKIPHEDLERLMHNVRIEEGTGSAIGGRGETAETQRMEGRNGDEASGIDEAASVQGGIGNAESGSAGETLPVAGERRRGRRGKSVWDGGRIPVSYPVSGSDGAGTGS